MSNKCQDIFIFGKNKKYNSIFFVLHSKLVVVCYISSCCNLHFLCFCKFDWKASNSVATGMKTRKAPSLSLSLKHTHTHKHTPSFSLSFSSFHNHSLFLCFTYTKTSHILSFSNAQLKHTQNTHTQRRTHFFPWIEVGRIQLLGCMSSPLKI
jgi:hypothetical protein